MAPGEQVVDQMPELVEERYDVGMLDQPASEVAHQHALGQLPFADTRHEVELCGVLVLAFTWMQVEIDAAQWHPVELDVVHRNVLVPRRRILHLGVAQPEEPAGDIEEPLSNLGEPEVPAHQLGVDIEALASHDLFVERGVGAIHHSGPGTIGTQSPQEYRQVPATGLLCGCCDLVNKSPDGAAMADHLHIGVEVGPGVEAEDPGMFGPRAQQLLQHPVVQRPGTVEKLHDQGAPCPCVQGECHERDHIGIVRGDRGAAISVERVRVDVVLRQAGQLVRGHRDAADVVADVLAELLVEEKLTVGQLSKPRPRRLVLVHPGPAEVTQGQTQDPGRRVIQPCGVGRGEDLEEVAIQAEVGRELVAFLLGRLRL